MPGWKRCAGSSTRRARMAGRALPWGSIFGHSSSATLKALTRSVALPGARLIRCLGYALDEATPDHSTISRTRRLYWVETHKAIFRWVVRILTGEGLISGQTVSIDATTLEANAAMKNIERREDGQTYHEYLKGLALAAGIENPTREQLARLDRKRKKKGSNEQWRRPADPDARITKRKDGRTHLAHKAEHAVDLSSGAVLAITLQPASDGDTDTIHRTLAEAQSAAREIHERAVEEVVADKGYHSGAVLKELHHQGVRTYIPEPDRGRRKWEGKAVEQKRTYENRRRVRGDRGRQLQKRRSELTERSFAHLYETGGMRRLYLRGRDNILKRLLLHAAAFNISLLLRKQLGRGKPRQCQGLSREFFAFYFLMLDEFSRAMAESETASTPLPSKPTIPRLTFERSFPDSRRALPPRCHSTTATTATGC